MPERIRTGLIPRALLTLALALTATLSASAVRIAGADYISLSETASRFGMERVVIRPGKEEALKSQWSLLRFKLHKRAIEVNGLKTHLGAPVALHNGALHIGKIDCEKTLKPLLAPQTITNAPKLYRIVIDPGHGGKDEGASNSSLGLREKDLTLDIALRLKKLLERLGYKVSLTRDNDRYLSLSERPAFANRHKADLFVSIHFNAVKSSRISGIETFVFTNQGQPSTARSKARASDRRAYPGNANDAWNALAGAKIQKALADAVGSGDRGLKRARFAVLKTLDCPGVLVEAGFLSSASEAPRLKSQAQRQKIAQAIANGIYDYQKALNRARGK